MNNEYYDLLKYTSDNFIGKTVRSRLRNYYNFKEKIEFDDCEVSQALDNIAKKNSFEQFPSELQFLLSVQKGFTILNVGLITIMLGIYACTANKTIEWNKKYFELQSIKKYEIPLASFSESLKNEMAEQSKQPRYSLTPPDPHKSLLFLFPANIPNVKSIPKSKVKTIPN